MARNSQVDLSVVIRGGWLDEDAMDVPCGWLSITHCN